ncbi:MAG: endopeptidase La [Holosporales bacterium]|jgi:ATP-dependent Lon protease|nr:endopeptidase La [Holosporales bacterium]
MPRIKKKTVHRKQTGSELSLPLVVLRDTVVFPEFVVPLFIGRQKSIKAIEVSFSIDQRVLLVTQKDPTIDAITPKDLFDFGTVCHIDQMIQLTDGTIKILISGLYRASIIKVIDDGKMMNGVVVPAEIIADREKEIDGLILALLSNFESFFKQNKKLPADVFSSVSSIEDPSKLCDTVASYLPLKISERQGILETLSVKERLEKLIFLMEEKSEIVLVEKKIKNRVKKQVEKNQKEYYLNEQLKAIYRELGDTDDFNAELKMVDEKIKKSTMSKEAKDKAISELKKLRNMAPMSQESGIVRTYIDWLINIPWISATGKAPLRQAEKILGRSHYGLEKIKERIMEYLAVRKRVPKMKAQIMCFVGPPGVGKTSLGKAIAEAIDRAFVRIALGGINDEAEIRGHRRTYVGAMPGKIMQAIRRAKIANPVVMLDEIDKLGADWRGDPASALLEVLDPEQNHAFVDNYIEIPYDLSEVMFITTANSLRIHPALLDRMELIYLTGYTEEEKLSIAKLHIILKQMEQNGLRPGELEITDLAINKIISCYTMESGVRSLEREISKISRKAVRKLVSNRKLKTIKVDTENIKDYLGVAKYSRLAPGDKPKVGVATGLAWTEAGGDVLSIEAILLPGTGNIISTGKLGEVMQESVKAAYSYVKSRYKTFSIDEEQFSKCDVHVHVPEGAVPKDGPSAGITICTAIVSAFSKKQIRADVAMTGEITLIGNVLRIGGLKEKLLAARRSGIKSVFIPKENERDIPELPNVILSEISIRCVSHIDEVLERVFV